jgi:hypothetical protein
MVEFVVRVLIVIAFPIIVENAIRLVDILFVRTVDPVMVEFTVIVLAVMTLPSIVTNPILSADRPVVLVVNAVTT